MSRAHIRSGDVGVLGSVSTEAKGLATDAAFFSAASCFERGHCASWICPYDLQRSWKDWRRQCSGLPFLQCSLTPSSQTCSFPLGHIRFGVDTASLAVTPRTQLVSLPACGPPFSTAPCAAASTVLCPLPRPPVCACSGLPGLRWSTESHVHACGEVRLSGC